MAGAELTGVLAVVLEVLRGEAAVLVADQAVGGDGVGVPLDLHLHVPGDRDERAGGLVDQHLLGLALRVDVGVVAVALVGQLLHRVVVEVAAAEAEHAEEHAAVALMFDQLDEIVVVGNADVEVAVGGEDDAVDALGDEVLAGLRVGEGDAGPAVGRPAGLEVVDRTEDRLLVGAGGRRQHQARGAGVGDHRDPVAGVHVLDQQAQASAQQRQLVGRTHRARDIDQEHEVARPDLGDRYDLALHADLHELVRGVPWTRPDLGVDREGAAVGRLLVVVVEVVDQLLGAHGVDRRQ